MHKDCFYFNEIYCTDPEEILCSVEFQEGVHLEGGVGMRAGGGGGGYQYLIFTEVNRQAYHIPLRDWQISP